jgi:hypothetical protein
MGKIRLVYVLVGISPRIWNGLRTYTEVPLYVLILSSHLCPVLFSSGVQMNILHALLSYLHDDHNNNIWEGVQILNLLIMQVSFSLLFLRCILMSSYLCLGLLNGSFRFPDKKFVCISIIYTVCSPSSSLIWLLVMPWDLDNPLICIW